MKWHVFKKDDPNTYPEFDCPMLLCKSYSDTNITLGVHCFDNKQKSFYEKDGISGRWYKAYNECFYSYIGYIPNGYKVYNPIRCINDTNCPIGCADNGYCLYDFCSCEQQVVVNEYEVEVKRIWKEF